jgi:protein TonB
MPLGSMEDAEARFRDVFQTRIDKTLFVAIADGAPYGRLIDYVTVARRSGVERIAPAPAFSPAAPGSAPRKGPLTEAGRFVAPVEVPDEIQPDADLGIEGGVPGGVEGGVPGGVVGGIVGGGGEAPPATPAVRVGGQIKEPKKLKHVNPVYPAIARQARVQGVVVLECTINRQGRVADIKILRGIPLLDAAAIEAVRQWVYEPTLINGKPVPVIMTVTLNFRIAGPGADKLSPYGAQG